MRLWGEVNILKRHLNKYSIYKNVENGFSEISRRISWTGGGDIWRRRHWLSSDSEEDSESELVSILSISWMEVVFLILNPLNLPLHSAETSTESRCLAILEILPWTGGFIVELLALEGAGVDWGARGRDGETQRLVQLTSAEIILIYIIASLKVIVYMVENN